MIDPLALFAAAVWAIAWTTTLVVIVVRTRKVIRQVMASSGKIEGSATAHFARMEESLKVELARFHGTVNELRAEAGKTDFSPLERSFETKLQGLTAQLDHKLQDVKASLTDIGVDIDVDGLAKQVYALIKSDEGVFTKKLQGELERMGGPIREMERALIDETKSARSPVDLALYRLLNVTVSDDFRERFPDYAEYLDQAKVAHAQLVEIMRGVKPAIAELTGQGVNTTGVVGSIVQGAKSRMGFPPV